MNQRLFAEDPINFFDPTPYTLLEYQGHMIVGTIWFAAALIAFFVSKGSPLHVRAGQICIISVFVIAITSAVMLAVDFVPPLALNAATASYAVVGGWLALKPASTKVQRAEWALTIFEIAVLATFLAIAIPNVMNAGVAPIGPGIVAVVPVILIAGDIHWHFRQEERARLRLPRHLARMVWAFAIVLRAPLVEFKTAGFYEVPDPLLVVGPVLLGLVTLLYFQWKYGTLKARGAPLEA